MVFYGEAQTTTCSVDHEAVLQRIQAADFAQHEVGELFMMFSPSTLL